MSIVSDPSAAVPIGDFGGEDFVDLLRWRAARQPERVLFTMLDDGESSPGRLTVTDLDRRARAIAARIRTQVEPGQRALMLYAGGLEFVEAFFGCLYAGVVAVPAYPPDLMRLERTMPRLNAIANDAQPRIVLSTQAIGELGERLGAIAPDLAGLPWLATDAVPAAAADHWSAPAITPATLCLIQYTSGSTATPKGVMVSHANLLGNEAMICAAFGHDTSCVGVSWLPMFHDMGLMGHVLQPVYLGVKNVLMSPLAFLRRPHRWLQAITDHRATTSGAPNFAYDICVRKITAEQRANLDLRSWVVAYNGAEPVSAETIERFTRAFAPCGFQPAAMHPCYGMAEATLIITGGRCRERPVVTEVDPEALLRHRVLPANGGRSRRIVGCGHTLLDQRVRIVDPESRIPCNDGEVGEIWVAGTNVAQGYWHRPDETASIFGASLAETGEGPFLRTGDLGFLWQAQLFVTGRLKDVVVIRGRNYYPQDLEGTVSASHSALRPGSGAAFAVEGEGTERLVVVQEVYRSAELSELDAVIAAIGRDITAEHQLQLHATVLVKAGTIPKTSSGKIRRRACRDHYEQGTLEELRRWVRGGAGSKPTVPIQGEA